MLFMIAFTFLKFTRTGEKVHHSWNLESKRGKMHEPDWIDLIINRKEKGYFLSVGRSRENLKSKTGDHTIILI